MRQEESGYGVRGAGAERAAAAGGLPQDGGAEPSQLVGALQRDLDCLLQQLKGASSCAARRCAAVAQALWTAAYPRLGDPTRLPPQPPWHWLRQLSRRGQLLRYLGVGTQVFRAPHLSPVSLLPPAPPAAVPALGSYLAVVAPTNFPSLPNLQLLSTPPQNVRS